MSDSIDTRLEAIQGGVALINERLKYTNQLQDERHENMRGEVVALKLADTLLDGRVIVLETESSVRSGERQGIALGGRIIWTIIGAVPVGIGAVLLRAFGA